MSDREIMQEIFEALERGLDGRLTVSKMGDKVFLAEDEQEWCLAVYPRADQQLREGGESTDEPAG